MADDTNNTPIAEDPGPHEADEGVFSLEPGSAAVIFQSTGDFGVILPRVNPGDPLPPSALMAMCVQELVEDLEMRKVLVERLVEKGRLGLRGPEPAEG